MSRRTRQKRSRPRRGSGQGVSAPSRSMSQAEWDRLAKYRGGGAGGESSQSGRWAEVGKRIDVAYDAIGHPQQMHRPVEEGKHYTTLAYTDWADSFVPTVVKWNHGAVDSFTDRAKSMENQRKAIQHAKTSGMSQRITLPVGGGTLKVGGQEYVWRGGDANYKAAQEKAKELRSRGYKAVIRKERVAGKPAYVIYTRKEAER